MGGCIRILRQFLEQAGLPSDTGRFNTSDLRQSTFFPLRLHRGYDIHQGGPPGHELVQQLAAEARFDALQFRGAKAVE